MSLQGKVAIVTGSARGIGRGCAIQLARDGAIVAVWDVNGEGAAETVRMIEEEGGTAVAYVGDASAREVIDATLQRIRKALGPVLVLVNNAAVVHFCPFLEIQDADIERIVRTNLIGPFILTQAVLPDMLANGWGRVINISSAAAQQGTKTLSHYAASKGGIMAWTRTVAMEFADRGVTVNNISPSFIDTAMRLELKTNNFEAAVAATPMKRAGQPHDIAAACSFLASEAAGYVTGQTLNVNGGLVLS
jgi:2-hydroxycyclohexanecarboxyl-CoA dehydrogenase